MYDGPWTIESFQKSLEHVKLVLMQTEDSKSKPTTAEVGDLFPLYESVPENAKVSPNSSAIAKIKAFQQFSEHESPKSTPSSTFSLFPFTTDLFTKYNLRLNLLFGPRSGSDILRIFRSSSRKPYRQGQHHLRLDFRLPRSPKRACGENLSPRAGFFPTIKEALPRGRHRSRGPKSKDIKDNSIGREALLRQDRTIKVRRNREAESIYRQQQIELIGRIHHRQTSSGLRSKHQVRQGRVEENWCGAGEELAEGVREGRLGGVSYEAISREVREGCDSRV